MFKIILNECNNRELYPDLLYFNVDFEIAVHKAAKTVFGEHILIRGAFIIYLKALTEKYKIWD